MMALLWNKDWMCYKWLETSATTEDSALQARKPSLLDAKTYLIRKLTSNRRSWVRPGRPGILVQCVACVTLTERLSAEQQAAWNREQESKSKMKWRHTAVLSSCAILRCFSSLQYVFKEDLKRVQLQEACEPAGAWLDRFHAPSRTVTLSFLHLIKGWIAMEEHERHDSSWLKHLP